MNLYAYYRAKATSAERSSDPSRVFGEATHLWPVGVAMRIIERRSVITAGLFASMALLPPAAWSLPALPAGSPADRLSRMLQSAAGPVRVKPQVLPRSKLENDFAVLLMRTTYSVADQLDYYPMDKFQQDQFLFRQDEWELYREALPGVQREW